MSERREGWYWCSLGGEWAPLHSDDHSMMYVDEIGPRIPNPDEPWQCVPKEPDGAMQVAGLKVRVEEDGTAAVYRAMLSAAPKPEDV